MHLHRPKIDLIGGPRDGATNHGATKYDWNVAVFPSGEVAVRVEWPEHPEWWLLYRGEFGFQGARTKLFFADYYPVSLTPAQ